MYYKSNFKFVLNGFILSRIYTNYTCSCEQNTATLFKPSKAFMYEWMNYYLIHPLITHFMIWTDKLKWILPFSYQKVYISVDEIFCLMRDKQLKTPLYTRSTKYFFYTYHVISAIKCELICSSFLCIFVIIFVFTLDLLWNIFSNLVIYLGTESNIN